MDTDTHMEDTDMDAHTDDRDADTHDRDADTHDSRAAHVQKNNITSYFKKMLAKKKKESLF